MFKLAVGAVLIVYPLFMLVVKKPPSITGGNPSIDAAVGVVSGFFGGFAGLSGIVLVIWSQLCRWSKHKARSILQLINMTILAIAIVVYGFRGLVSAELLKLAVLCAPATLCGSWIGLRLYERIDQ